MSSTEIKVPNIGDFKDVEVIEVLVSEGQTLKKDDPLITIESDKSSVEIPSNFDGKIKTLKTKVGDKVSEGDLILILENINNEAKEKDEKKLVIEKDIKKSDKVSKTELSKIVAERLAKKAQEKKITKIFFDRGVYKYHGRIKVFAETLRKNGMEF